MFILKTTVQSPYALAALNTNTLDLWHAQLGYLGKQNVKRLEGMSTGMDLSKELDNNDVCEPCVQSKLHSLPYKGYIKPGKYKNELFHFDIFGPLKGYNIRNRYKYGFMYLEDKTK